MEQSGEYRIQADLETVWQGLNDPEVLARCIDGCQSMEKTADNAYRAAVKARVGPVSALFNATLTLENVDVPKSYTLVADVKGGAAGFGKGTADVTLSADENSAATVLRYQVRANVGGKLAQVGSRLIDGTARKMADDFFATFGEVISGETPEAIGRMDEDSGRFETSGQWKIWLIVFAALLLAMLFAF